MPECAPEDDGMKEEWLPRAIDALIVAAIFATKALVALGGAQLYLIA